MIANIVTGSSFAGCTEYAYCKDEAEVIAFKDRIPDNHITAANGFEIQARMNKRVSNPVGHISISFKPEDGPRLTNEFMAQLVQEYMDKMDVCKVCLASNKIICSLIFSEKFLFLYPIEARDSSENKLKYN